MNGVPCPACGWHESIVSDSRPGPGTVRRRRKCVACDHPYGTVEFVLPAEGIVVKPGIGMTPPVLMRLPDWLARARDRLSDAIGEALR